MVLRAVEAAGQAVDVSDRPRSGICDTSGSLDSDAWRLEILGGKDAVAYVGPFVVDHNHPLAEGLSLQSAIWSGVPQTPLTGLPIVTAGNVTLMTDREDSPGRHRLQMQLCRGPLEPPGHARLADLVCQPVAMAAGGTARSGCAQRPTGPDRQSDAGSGRQARGGCGGGEAPARSSRSMAGTSTRRPTMLACTW